MSKTEIKEINQNMYNFKIKQIVKIGTRELARKIEENGYAEYK